MLSLDVDRQSLTPQKYLQTTTLTLPVHAGSHVDALLHCRADGWGTQDLSLDDVIGTAVVLDLSEKGSNASISANDLSRYGDLAKPGLILLVHTGWCDLTYGTEDFFSNSPFIDREGAAWLASRKPKAVGFDFAEDYCLRLPVCDPDAMYCHQLLLGQHVAVIEGLVNLGSLPRQTPFQFFAPFVKLTSAECSLVRAFAILD